MDRLLESCLQKCKGQCGKFGCAVYNIQGLNQQLIFSIWQKSGDGGDCAIPALEYLRGFMIQQSVS